MPPGEVSDQFIDRISISEPLCALVSVIATDSFVSASFESNDFGVWRN
jgi:hypothetical protein